MNTILHCMYLAQQIFVLKGTFFFSNSVSLDIVSRYYFLSGTCITWFYADFLYMCIYSTTFFKLFVSLWLLANLSHLFFRFMNLVFWHLVGFLGLGGQPITNPLPAWDSISKKTRTNLHVLKGIWTWTCDPSVWAAKTHILDRMATVNNIVYLHDENHLIIFCVTAECIFSCQEEFS